MLTSESDQDDLMVYLAAVKGDTDRLDAETKGSCWLKNAPDEVIDNTVKKKDAAGPADKSLSYSLSYSIDDSTTDFEEYMNEINMSEDLPILTDSITKQHNKISTKNKQALTNNNHKMEDHSDIEDPETNSDDESFVQLHGNIYTLDDLVAPLPLATTQPVSSINSEMSQMSKSDRVNPLSNLHMIGDLDDNERLVITSNESINKTDYEYDYTQLTEESIPGVGNLMSHVHVISELENGSQSDSSNTFSDKHSNNDITSSRDQSTSFEDHNYSNTHHLSQNKGRSDEEYSIKESIEDRSHDISTMSREKSRDNTSERSQDNSESSEQEYEYSMDFDTPDTSEDESKENTRNGAVTTPSFARQPNLLKDQSCQTDNVNVPEAPPTNSYLHCSPLLPYTVKPEELEVLTAYSPATVALHDLLRSQLALTEKLVNQTRHLSEHMSTSITPDHRYITLSQTKKYISLHKPKVLTYKEALKRVKKDYS